MRHLAVVGAAHGAGPEERASDRLGAWLDALPSAGVRRVDRLAEVPLEQVDVVWARDEQVSDARFLAWLGAGGRVLATTRATRLVTALGFEPAAPTDLPVPEPVPSDLGLAGFGPHPLFTGLRDGALLGRGARAPAAVGYEGHWPSGDVVALGRRGLTLEAGRVLAWEYAIGDGGLLCLGLEPVPSDGSPDGELVLANALVGDAIPHRDRLSPAIHWPRPGTQATRAADGSGLVRPPRVWPASSLPALDLVPGAGWVHAGRRLLVRARGPSDGREVWAPPFRVMRAAAVRDAIPCAPARITADEVAGGLALGGHRLLERWLAAPGTPVGVWEVGGPADVEIVLEWSVDLRRAWPYPPGAYGDLTFDVGDEHRTLQVQAAGGPRMTFAVEGANLAAEPVPGEPAVRVRCTGRTPVQVVVAAGVDAVELARAHKALEGGVQRLAETRTRHAMQLERYGTAFEAPAPALVRAFAWARERGDEALIGAPGVGRSVLTPCPRSAEEGAWCFGPQAATVAAAQLVAGNRDPAREVLTFLAQAQEPDGGIPAVLPTGGLAAPADPVSTAAFLRLAQGLFAWTGDLDAFRRLRGALAAALSYLAAQPAGELPVSVLEGIEPLVDRTAAALVALRGRATSEPPGRDVEPHLVIEAAAASLRRDAGALVGGDAGSALLEGVAALWGLEPDAPAGALALAPRMPAGWPGHALRGLRVGRSVLDLEARRRPDALVIRVAHRFGPRLVLTVAAPGVAPVAAEVDDVPLPTGRVRFESHARHEVRFHLPA
jgi:hypothetical protein